MTVEYRTWTSVAGLPFEVEDGWLPVTRHLERQRPDLGPVATWEGDSLVLVLAAEHPDAATAAEQAALVVSDALHACGLTDRFATVFRVDAVSAAVAA
jgi:hypothetical protein